MPIVQVQILAGRPSERVEVLGAELTDTVQRVLGVPRETIRVVVSEIPASHWFKDGVSIQTARGGASLSTQPPGAERP